MGVEELVSPPIPAPALKIRSFPCFPFSAFPYAPPANRGKCSEHVTSSYWFLLDPACLMASGGSTLQTFPCLKSVSLSLWNLAAQAVMGPYI